MRVAVATGRPVLDVARDPFAWTAVTFARLEDLDRQATATRDAEELRLAERIALAFHEPAKLAAERRALADRLRPRVSAADARARARQLAQRLGALE